MAKKASSTKDNVVFSVVNEKAIERLKKDGKIDLPEKKISIPKDMRWNEKNFNNAIIAGLEKGESIEKISRRLLPEIMSKTDFTGKTQQEIYGKGGIIAKNIESSVRNARTMVTSAENHGRLDSYKELERQGVIIKKEWMATPDDRTRPSHIDIDGETQNLDDPFTNGCQFPGDGNGPAEEVWMCRCTMRSDILGFRNADGSVSMVDYKRDDTLHDKQMDEEIERRGIQEDEGYDEEELHSIGDLKYPERPRKEDFENDEDYRKALDEYKNERNAYNERINEILDEVNHDAVFETIDDAKKWAKDIGISIDKEVFEKIDLKAFNEVKPALEEMFERFPELKSYDKEWFNGNIEKTKFGIYVTDDGLLSANGGFCFNSRDFSTENLNFGLKQAYDQMADGTLVRGDGSFRTLVRHEFGHNVQNYIESNIAGKYHYFVDDWRKNFDKFDDLQKAMEGYRNEYGQYRKELYSLANLKGASEYSNTNERELFAEGFAAYTSGQKTEFAIKFGEFLKRWY